MSILTRTVVYVKSSAISRIAYDPKSGRMQIAFRRSDGQTSDTHEYPGVTPEVWEAFRNSESKGRHFGEHLRGRYEARKLDPNTDEVWS
jgi:hypothetical protein